MNDQLNNLMDWIAKDFAQWRARGEHGGDGDYDEMLDSLQVEEGRKYYKITHNLHGQTMVWGFVVKKDEPPKCGKSNFKAGDILKAASWATPARNKPRGNIIQGDFSWVRWTGPEYL